MKARTHCSFARVASTDSPSRVAIAPTVDDGQPVRAYPVTHALALIAIGAGFVHALAVVVAVATIALVAIQMPGTTWVRRVVTAVPAIVGATACVFTVLAFLHMTPDLVRVLQVVAVGAAVIGIAAPATARARILDDIDVCSAVTAVVVAIAVARTTPGWTAGAYLARLARGTDATRHVAIGAAVAAHHGYVTFAPTPALMDFLHRYPQGGAGLLALIGRSAGVTSSAASLADTGYWVAVAVFALTAWLAVSVALVGAARIVGVRATATARVTATGAIALMFTVGPAFFVFDQGYFAQEVATLALFAIVLAVVSGSGSSRAAITASVLVVALTQSWYLITPIAVGVVALFWWRTRPGKWAFLGGILCAPFVAFPIATGPSAAKQLSAFGGTISPGRVAVCGALIAIVAGLIALRVQPEQPVETRVITQTFAMLLAMTVLVAIFQLLHGGLGYYTVKLFDLSLLYGGVVVAVGLAVATAGFAHTPQRILAGAASAGVLTMTAMCLPYFIAHTGTPAARQVAEASAYLQRHPDGLPPGSAAAAVDGCGAPAQLLTQAFANMSRQWSPAVDEDVARNLAARPGDVSALIDLASRSRILEIYTYRPCDTAAVATLRRQPHVRIVLIR